MGWAMISHEADDDQANPGRVLLIGVGNDWRRDDGAGLAVARRLQKLGQPWLTVQESAGDPAALLASFQEAATVILVDAAASGAEPGTVFKLEADVDSRPLRKLRQNCRGSSHGLGVAEAVELARALDLLPPRLVIYGLEGADFGPGPGLSAVVAQAVEEAAGRILREAAAGQVETVTEARS